ncbi:MAG: hypothetical protein RL026_875 [Pseudomonadota bacterium]
MAGPVTSHGTTIGCIGHDLPTALLMASGRPWRHLPWQCGLPAPFAAQWLEDSFPGWAFGLLEQWAAGAFDDCAEVLFSRGDDATQRLYYYVCELQRAGRLRGPVPQILDIAYIPRVSSQQRMVASLQALAGRWGVDESALAQGIGRFNASLAQAWPADTARRPTGRAAARLAQASLDSGFEAFLAQHPPVIEADPRPRLLLAGSAPPDLRLHDAVEAAGWQVAAEWHTRSLARLGTSVREDLPPFEALALQMRAQALGPRSFADPAVALGAAARQAGAQAVLLWLCREDEAYVWHVPAQRRVLATAGLPLLALTARRWDAADGAAAEIMTFLESLPT